MKKPDPFDFDPINFFGDAKLASRAYVKACQRYDNRYWWVSYLILLVMVILVQVGFVPLMQFIFR